MPARPPLSPRSLPPAPPPNPADSGATCRAGAGGGRGGRQPPGGPGPALTGKKTDRAPPSVRGVGGGHQHTEHASTRSAQRSARADRGGVDACAPAPGDGGTEGGKGVGGASPIGRPPLFSRLSRRGPKKRSPPPPRRAPGRPARRPAPPAINATRGGAMRGGKGGRGGHGAPPPRDEARGGGWGGGERESSPPPHRLDAAAVPQCRHRSRATVCAVPAGGRPGRERCRQGGGGGAWVPPPPSNGRANPPPTAPPPRAAPPPPLPSFPLHSPRQVGQRVGALGRRPPRRLRALVTRRRAGQAAAGGGEGAAAHGGERGQERGRVCVGEAGRGRTARLPLEKEKKSGAAIERGS